ncbi:transposon, putative [Talaromyces stipitatus ATCC 10500]|uniref:Transposon, putative n=1 Tax=Talaromyces stipitatus (strain ATCC 10500 / CBS 375.48 / QM 6759 / NRRL 1006) TaxID=441959 RepID=B8MU95_TALSN|nr:transposon, putative [Talaromyces stipitatus ATCC 10500]EED11599.1 transposon, putative [Talaromyces stipitatus ATCC 10500]
MPPTRTENRQKLVEQEGKILLAISDLKNGRIRSVLRASEIYQIPRTTLRDRLNGIEYRGEKRANSHIVTQYEEESLLKWILDLDKRGLPPRPSLVQDMADLLLSQRENRHVSERWVYRFVDRHPEEKLRFSRRYNYERAKCEDIKIIQEHFNRVQEVIQEYGILSEDIYNFDETGFAMSLCASAKVITGSDRYGYYNLVIANGSQQLKQLIQQDGLCPHILSSKQQPSINKADEIGLQWLQKHFIPHTTSRTKGRYRMLILDGHGSHLTPQFDQICTENNIIPVCMPPHSSHLLQPLDVGCFAVLKRQYALHVEQRVRLGFNHIDKYDFLTAFPEARTVAYKAENIQNGFKATGLVPFDPDHVYQKLTVQLRTPTPPPSRSSDSQSSCLQTPQNARQFKRQITTIKKRIDTHKTSPLDRIAKAYEVGMKQFVIIQKEVHDLRAANEKEKRKRQRSKRQISHEGDLTVQEAQKLIISRDQASRSNPAVSGESEPQASQPRVREPPKCSGCGIIGHKINRCSNRTTS